MVNNQLETVSKAYAGPIENAINDIVKNKLTGWHGIVHSEFNYETARYEA